MRFSIHILGSSCALPTSKKFPAAHLINHDERLFLLDCGEGTQIQYRRYKFRFHALKAIFISHLHGDHIFGLPGLLSTLSLLGRKQSLSLYGPAGLENWLRSLFQNIGAVLNYSLDFNVVKSNEPYSVYEDNRLMVEAFPLIHSVETYGYRFVEKKRPLNVSKEVIAKYNLSVDDIVKIKNGDGFYYPKTNQWIPNIELCLPAYHPRSYAYCSDTAYKQELSDWLKGTDLVFHETTFMEADRKLAADTQHSTTLDAANTAKHAGVKKLLAGHISLRYEDMSAILTEIRTVFPEAYLATEGDEYKIELVRET